MIPEWQTKATALIESQGSTGKADTNKVIAIAICLQFTVMQCVGSGECIKECSSGRWMMTRSHSLWNASTEPASQSVLYDQCHRHYKMMITLTVGRFVVDLNKYALLSQDGRGCTAECFKNQVAPMQCNASSWLARGVKKSKISDVLP